MTLPSRPRSRRGRPARPAAPERESPRLPAATSPTPRCTGAGPWSRRPPGPPAQVVEKDAPLVAELSSSSTGWRPRWRRSRAGTTTWPVQARRGLSRGGRDGPLRARRVERARRRRPQQPRAAGAQVRAWAEERGPRPDDMVPGVGTGLGQVSSPPRVLGAACRSGRSASRSWQAPAAREADLVVTNHAMSHRRIRVAGVLPSTTSSVVDEAHDIVSGYLRRDGESRRASSNAAPGVPAPLRSAVEGLQRAALALRSPFDDVPDAGLSLPPDRRRDGPLRSSAREALNRARGARGGRRGRRRTGCPEIPARPAHRGVRRLLSDSLASRGRRVGDPWMGCSTAPSSSTPRVDARLTSTCWRGGPPWPPPPPWRWWQLRADGTRAGARRGQPRT
jgi:hypothetical protein